METATIETPAEAAPDDNETEQHMVRVYEAETELQERQRELTECEEELEGARAAVKAKQAEVDSAVRHLQNVIRCRDERQGTLPFTEPKAADAWKAEPLSVLVLSDGMVEKLLEAEIADLGALCEWRSEDPPRKKVAGIGEAALQKIDDAIQTYFAQHPQGVGKNGDGEEGGSDA